MIDSVHKKVVLTIDLEDWFHSLDPNKINWGNYERRIEYGTKKILEFLSNKNSSATFYVLGDVAQHHPQLIKQIYIEGHEIGSHGYDHNFIYKQSPSKFQEDLKKSIGCLSDLIGEKIISYRAPYFSVTKESHWALDIMKEEGIKYDSSIFPVINHRYGIPGSIRLPYQLSNEIWEWPITTFQTFLGNIPFAGGVYFRFLPALITNYFISTLLKKEEPVLLYFHPWEFDPDQPKINSIPNFLIFRHYYGLKNNFYKFSSLLQNLKTISLKQGIENLSKDYSQLLK